MKLACVSFWYLKHIILCSLKVSPITRLLNHLMIAGRLGYLRAHSVSADNTSVIRKHLLSVPVVGGFQSSSSHLLRALQTLDLGYFSVKSLTQTG